ncbi:hypothetical protein D3C85_1799780 [compost metagenome]
MLNIRSDSPAQRHEKKTVDLAVVERDVIVQHVLQLRKLRGSKGILIVQPALNDAD